MTSPPIGMLDSSSLLLLWGQHSHTENKTQSETVEALESVALSKLDCDRHRVMRCRSQFDGLRRQFIRYQNLNPTFPARNTGMVLITRHYAQSAPFKALQPVRSRLSMSTPTGAADTVRNPCFAGSFSISCIGCGIQVQTFQESTQWPQPQELTVI